MRHLRSLAIILAALLVIAPAATPPHTLSQGDVLTCPALVRSALDTTGELCDGTGRNEACYGNILVEADARADVASFRFEERGDIVDVADMQSVRTSPLDPIKGEWGVALLRLQALLRDEDPARTITLVLMGNAVLEPLASEEAPAEVTTMVVTPNHPRLRSNIRQAPTTASAVVGKLNPGESIVATGRLVDGSWLRVELPSGGFGWVFADLVSGEESFNLLPVVDARASAAGPMHAFYLTSGADDAACPEAPESGLLVQTPEGVAEVTLLINEVDIQLGSTVFFQAEPGVGMRIYVVEGHGRVTAQGVTEFVPAGAFTTVPLGADRAPTGPPADAKPYELARVTSLPIPLLDRPIEIAEPADDGDNLVGQPVKVLEEEEPVFESAGDEGTGDEGGGPPPKERKNNERPGNPNPPANPQPPGNPNPPGNPPPLSDFVPSDDEPGKGKGRDKDKKMDVVLPFFAV